MEMTSVQPKPTLNLPTKICGHKLRDAGTLMREDFDGGPVSMDEIEPGLYLGNLTAATHMDTLKSFKITHILTLDSVQLPQHILEASFLTTKYVHISDMPKEDILHHLDECTDFISEALGNSGNILVHCYFGVSRSSAVVIAYAMKRYNLEYQAAYELVKSKRRYVQPNAGFIAQLKLYQRMGCRIDKNCQKYKIYRLRFAGEQVRKAKILPQSFNNVIKADPGITQENPEPIVYRCRKCRRILASKSHVLVHQHKKLRKQQQQQQESSTAEKTTNAEKAELSSSAAISAPTPRLLEQISIQMRKASLGSPLETNTTATMAIDEQQKQQQQQPTLICHSILFVEPIAWMKNISHNTQGRLMCPKCDQKLGNFSWINGCQCPCGEEVSPAFYLIPSKVELSKAVQNVQTTI